MLCFTQIYQISYPSHISLLSALYSPSAYCPDFQDGPLPGPIGCPFLAARMYLPEPARCTFPDRLDAPSRTDLIYLPGPTPCTFPDRPHVPSRTDPMYLPERPDAPSCADRISHSQAPLIRPFPATALWL